jgi:RecA-family ATPase
VEKGVKKREGMTAEGKHPNSSPLQRQLICANYKLTHEYNTRGEGALHSPQDHQLAYMHPFQKRHYCYDGAEIDLKCQVNEEQNQAYTLYTLWYKVP